MAQIKVKRSSVPGKVPTTAQLELGEIAINTYDGIAYIKRDVSGTETVVQLGGGGGGGGDVTTTGTQTLTNKRITPRIVSIASASTITPTGDTADQYVVTALATNATIATPSGTATDGQRLIIRIEDDGTSRTLTWTTGSGNYRAVGVTLPTTTVATKTVYVGCVYNQQDVFWDVVAVASLA